MRPSIRRMIAVIAISILLVAILQAVDTKFHNAPDSAKTQRNPYEGQPAAIDAGKRLYARNCLSCHGKTGLGKGNVPSLLVTAKIAESVDSCTGNVTKVKQLFNADLWFRDRPERVISDLPTNQWCTHASAAIVKARCMDVNVGSDIVTARKEGELSVS